MHPTAPLVTWAPSGAARWRSAEGRCPPPRVTVVGDELSADHALRLAAEGTGLLWRGDHHNGCRLLDAMRRRLDAPRRRPLAPADEYHRQRQHRARTARLLGALLVELAPGVVLELPRAPRVDAAVNDVLGPLDEPTVLSLRELLGMRGAHRLRTSGVAVAALGGRRIHPHYGVFAPTRGDYLDLVAHAPLPPAVRTAFDIGTGTGVLAALLRQRGIARVVATDATARAVTCARDNVERLGLAGTVTVEHRDLFPRGRAGLVVANPPWFPGSPRSSRDAGVFDRHGAMLTGFVGGLADHLTPGGRAWLVLSDLPELLGLRAAGTVSALAGAAGLVVHDRIDAAAGPFHDDTEDPLAGIRRRERVHLWVLGRYD